MKDFPKWMLALAGVNLLPVLASPFHLFGAKPFGEADSTWVRFLLYLATQMLWLLPLVLFFVSLDSYRRGYTWRGIIEASVGVLISGFGLWSLLA